MEERIAVLHTNINISWNAAFVKTVERRLSICIFILCHKSTSEQLDICLEDLQSSEYSAATVHRYHLVEVDTWNFDMTFVEVQESSLGGFSIVGISSSIHASLSDAPLPVLITGVFYGKKSSRKVVRDMPLNRIHSRSMRTTIRCRRRTTRRRIQNGS